MPTFDGQAGRVGPVEPIAAASASLPSNVAPLFAPSTAWTALCVVALCYLGARAGVWFTFPTVGAAVLFLPYAVLFTALVTSPPHRWWIFIAAGTLGNVLGHIDGGAGASFALLTEVANIARALVAAAGVRRFARSIGKFDDLRSMKVFLVFAVGLGPCVGAFIGGAIVTLTGISTDYWLTWEEWFLSNALTAISICPLALAMIWSFRNRDESRAFHASFRARRLEGVLVAAALVALGAGVFAFSPPDLVVRPARFYWPLPLLLWTAVRFPPAGISSAVLGVAGLTIWGAAHGRGPFVTASPTDSLLNLQLFLIALSLPLLLLASLVVQSARAAEDRLLAEEQRRELEAERRVALTLQDADRRKDEFLAILAHELRNPLAPVEVTLEALRRQTRPGSEVAHGHELIARQLRYMTRLVDDLLDVSRITRGKIELRLDSIDLRDVVANGIETARPQVDDKRHEIAVSMPREPLHVRGDSTRLSQIVGNLVNNAARYTEAGGRIEVTASRRGDDAILCVRDNGIGIPADKIDDIFGLFVQVRHSGMSSRGGLGIGLSLVKRLAELHDGKVAAESEGAGRGSTFTVTLPALPPASVQTAQVMAEDDTSLDAPLEILVVDDNVDAAVALAGLLELWGHTTHVAHDGAAALNAVRALDLDVVLLDLDLPKVDGYAVASSLRTDHGLAELVLIALSGFGAEQHRERTVAAGFDHHLVKPVDITSLRTLLRQTAGT